jgi:hypothetical protein
MRLSAAICNYRIIQFGFQPVSQPSTIHGEYYLTALSVFKTWHGRRWLRDINYKHVYSRAVHGSAPQLAFSISITVQLKSLLLNELYCSWTTRLRVINGPYWHWVALRNQPIHPLTWQTSRNKVNFSLWLNLQGNGGKAPRILNPNTMYRWKLHPQWNWNH